MENQERNKLYSLHRAVSKARWVYLTLFILYGVSIATLTRTLGYEGYSVESNIRQFLTRGWAIFWVIAALIIWILLKKKKDSFSLEGLKQLSFWQVGMDMFFVTGQFIIVSGLEGTTGILYLFPLAIAAVLFRPIGIIITTVLIILISGLTVLLDYIGLIPHFALYVPEIASKIYENPVTLIFNYFGLFFVIIVVAVMFWLVAKISQNKEL